MRVSRAEGIRRVEEMTGKTVTRHQVDLVDKAALQDVFNKVYKYTTLKIPLLSRPRSKQGAHIAANSTEANIAPKIIAR